MADTGFTNPTANEGDGVNPEFTLPNNAHASDNVYATDLLVDNGRNTNKWYGFGLDPLIPTGATINGVEVQVEYVHSGVLGSEDSDIEALQDGRVAAGWSKPFASQTSEAYYTFGGAADLWGQAWVKSDFTDANFGVYIRSRDSAAASRNLSIDHIRVKVYYTAPQSPSKSMLTKQAVKRASFY